MKKTIKVPLSTVNHQLSSVKNNDKDTIVL